MRKIFKILGDIGGWFIILLLVVAIAIAIIAVAGVICTLAQKFL